MPQRMAAGTGAGRGGVTMNPQPDEDDRPTLEEVLDTLSNGTVCPTCGPKGAKPLIWPIPNGKLRYLFKCCGTSVDKGDNE
jgi:hypothetical protein